MKILGEEIQDILHTRHWEENHKNNKIACQTNEQKNVFIPIQFFIRILSILLLML